MVDNASVDRSTQLVKDHFPAVKLIANLENVGFAKANNQALHISQGEYVLLLNPDTVVSEDTFHTCIEFMDQHPETGAVGVRMLDGSGRFLPESKRGLPTLTASFMKMTGLYKLFPRSSLMNSYYKGEISENTSAPIDVLSGAFMFIRQSVLAKTGFLDEDFFMYGEDIDLSYRITQQGYKIYYLPQTSIVHYKGESTKKSSLNYLLTFYEAMLIFTNKHKEFSGQKIFINIAIYIHGFIRYLRQLINKWWPPLLDASLIALSFFTVAKLWATYFYHQPDYFSKSFYLHNIPIYSLIAVIAMWLNGAYDKPNMKKASWFGFAWAFISILIIYGLLPMHMRTSRMVIVLGALLYMLFLILTRWKLHPWSISSSTRFEKEDRRAIIIAGPEESNRIKELINRSRDHVDIIGTVMPEHFTAYHDHLAIGDISQIEEIIRVHRVKEIIFSAQDIPFSTFTSTMSTMGPGLRYMLAASNTMNIVGSMNKDTEGESYAIRINFKLSHPASLRTKRFFDLTSSLIMLILLPVLILFIRPIPSLVTNVFRVLTGKSTWVSYHPKNPMIHSLPPLRQGILTMHPDNDILSSRKIEHIDYVYAKDYHWTTDLSILITQWRNIGQNSASYA